MEEQNLSDFEKAALDFYKRWENSLRYIGVMLTIAVLLQLLERI